MAHYYSGSHRVATATDFLGGPVMRRWGAVAVVAVGACGADPTTQGPPEPGTCEGTYEAPTALGAPQAPELVEVSGLVASRSSPDVLWAHADSGNASEIFALDAQGALLGRVAVTGAAWTDAEDLATAACPAGGGVCLWIADTGDNGAIRASVELFAVREPSVDATTPFGATQAPFMERLAFTYEDGPHDVEALIVDLDATTAWLFEKVDGDTARFYVLDLQAPPPHVARLGGALQSPGLSIAKGKMITGASLHPGGSRILLRTYTGSFQLRFDGDLTSALVGASLEALYFGPIDEPQGEAITYAASGVEFLTVSEDPAKVAPQPLHWYACRPPKDR